MFMLPSAEMGIRKLAPRNGIFKRTFLLLSFVYMLTVIAITLSGTEITEGIRRSWVTCLFGPRVTTTNISRSSRRFLMQALVFPRSGPQNNYMRFQGILPLAVLQNRSVVLYPIRDHITQDNANEVRNFNETFDVDRLGQFLPVATPREFYEECGGRAVISDAYKNGNLLEDIFIDTGLRFQQIEAHDCNIMGFFSEERRLAALQEHPCVIYRSLSFMHFNNRRWNRLAERADRYLAKAPYIRQLGKEATQKICDGKPFLGFHWRNRTGERCMIWNQWYGCGSKKLDLQDEAENFVEVFLDFMKKTNVTCVYLAYPPFAERMYTILRRRISQLFTKKDLVEGVPSIASYQDDNYVISLVEQEIIKQAKVFIGCGGSAWTLVAESERNRLNRSTIYLASLQHIPKGVIDIN